MNQIDRSNITGGEYELILWQFNQHLGGFKGALWNAIPQADMGNLEALQRAFPEQIAAYKRYISEPGYWAALLIRAGLLEAPKPVEEAPAANEAEGGGDAA